MDEYNITQEEVKRLAKKQELTYVNTFEKLLLNKNKLLSQPKVYQEELFVLHKLIKHNKAHGNKYAVLRDEVLAKSYQILQAQNRMTRHILRSLDQYDYDEFDIDMNNEFTKNQEIIHTINTVDYKPFLKIKDNNEALLEAQKNIKDYYALFEINADMIKHYSISQKRIYILNKYSRYKILSTVLYLDYTEWGISINTILNPYNLSIAKLFLILVISLFLYILRTQVYRLAKRLLNNIKYTKKYSQEILDNAHQAVNLLFIVINLQIIIYIYNNFYNVENLAKFFNITYALIFTFILYRVLNTVASIRINDMDHTGKIIKSEMINVGIKIINFLIMIMGLLLVMHFAGANLATVLSGLGIGGLAIALAARESLSNFLGTISILMSDTFSQGDTIVVDGEHGAVVEIGLRVTTLRTFDNSLISIPNGTIANQGVQNWSRRSLGRRIKMSLGVKYDSKPANIRQAISEIRVMLQTHSNIATDKTKYEHARKKSIKLVSQDDAIGVKKTLLVYLDELSDSSINILVYCFTKTIDWGEWLETKEDIIYQIMDILEKNDLEFAYPSISLYHENEIKK